MTQYTLRRYYTYHKLDTEQASEWEEKLTKALNYVSNDGTKPAYSKNVNEYGLLLEFAVSAIQNILATDGDKGARRDQAIADKLRAVRAHGAMVAKMAELFERLGLDGFVEFCEKNGIDNWQEFIEEDYTLFKERQEMSWADRAREWLIGILSSGEPTPTDSVKVSALMMGIIDSSTEATANRDWNKLCVLAHREGYTDMSHRGYWKLKRLF